MFVLIQPDEQSLLFEKPLDGFGGLAGLVSEFEFLSKGVAAEVAEAERLEMRIVFYQAVNEESFFLEVGHKGTE